MLSRAILSSIVLLAGNAAAANFLSNGLAVTPQMGWVSLFIHSKLCLQGWLHIG